MADNPGRRVLYVTTSTTIGGAEKTLRMLAGGLKRWRPAGVLSLKKIGPVGDLMKADGLDILTLRARRIPSLDAFLALRRILLDRSPDLVHAFLYTAIQMCRGVKALGIRFPLVSSPRVNYRTRPAPLLALDRLLRGRDDLLAAESDASARFFTERLGYDAAKVRTIRNGLDEGPPADDPERRRAIVGAGAGTGTVLVGAVGRLDAQKGQRVLLKAMAMLPSRYHAVVIGDGPDRFALETAARELGLRGRVRFLGERPDARRWLSALDLFVHPSLWEGTPNAVMEAMQAGLPVVASSVDGVEEIVEDGAGGRLTPPGDPQALAAAIAELGSDPRRRAALGKAGARRAKGFSLKDMVANYEDLYDELTASAAAGKAGPAPRGSTARSGAR